MILTFFTGSLTPITILFFITHFLICHSFLDSYIRHDLARNWGTGFWRESCAGRPGWHSRTVAQSHSTLAFGSIGEHLFVILAFGSIGGTIGGSIMSQSRLNHVSISASITVTCHTRTSGHMSHTISVTCHTPQTRKSPCFPFPTM